MKPGRNDPCSCGSGRKYKNCCMKKANPGSQDFPETKPREPTADDWNLLYTLFRNSRYDELEKLTGSLIDLYPDAGRAWKLYALSLHMQNKDALPAIQKAVELLPDDAEAHGTLAGLLCARGQLELAAVMGRRAVQINPGFAEGYNNLGMILKELGNIEESVLCYRRAIELKPDIPETSNNLGVVLQEQGHHQEAVSCFRKALLVKPEFSEAHNNLGLSLKELGDLQGALASCNRALEINPRFAKAFCNQGLILRELGRFGDEEQAYQQALTIDPDCVEAIVNQGRWLLSNGRMDDAERSFRRAIQLRPGSLEARVLLAQSRKARPGDENFTALSGWTDSGRPLSSVMSVSLHYALGKCFDDMGDFDNAFMHFMQGATLMRSTLEYDADQTSRRFDDIIRVFSPAAIERLKGAGNPSDLPIFVLGMPRSGTTLVERIIASHPQVHGAGELPDLARIVQRDEAGAAALYPENVEKIDRSVLARWASEYVAILRRRAPESVRITDKMPANFLFIGLLHVMLPNARIIHVRRDPVDTCLSCFIQHFTSGQDYSYDLVELGRYYADYTRLMHHWRDVLPAEAMLEIQYEDLVSHQETEARRLIGFCGLDWDDACMRFHLGNQAIHTASVTQVRQPIYTSSVKRWKNYEKHLAPLLTGLGELKAG